MAKSLFAEKPKLGITIVHKDCLIRLPCGCQLIGDLVVHQGCQEYHSLTSQLIIASECVAPSDVQKEIYHDLANRIATHLNLE